MKVDVVIGFQLQFLVLNFISGISKAPSSHIIVVIVVRECDFWSELFSLVYLF